ncbi:MAG: phospholipase D family protein [Clostridium neonatale]
MAIVKYLMQGLNETENHLGEVRKVVGSKEFTNIVILSAYLRENAVIMLDEQLKRNKDKIIAFIGIRNGATSFQGLMKLFETGIDIYVVDTGSINYIFHMKNYLGFNDNKGVAIVGSANFTPSGFMRNIESSSIIELDFNIQEDKQYLDTLLSDKNKLINDYPENVIRILDENQIQKLLEEGRIVDEKSESVVKRVGKNKKNDNIVPRMKLKIARYTKNSDRDKKESNKDENNQAKTSLFVSDEALKLIEVWKSKGLTERDLNVPSTQNTNVTGSMLLKKGKYEVDQQTYFRENVFKDLTWTSVNPSKPYFQYAWAEFYFVIDGVEYGKRKLQIKHDTRTDTKTYMQKQPMTHLLWGEAKEFIANRSLLEKELTLYKVCDTNNEFLIDIQ